MCPFSLLFMTELLCSISCDVSHVVSISLYLYSSCSKIQVWIVLLYIPRLWNQPFHKNFSGCLALWIVFHKDLQIQIVKREHCQQINLCEDRKRLSITNCSDGCHLQGGGNSGYLCRGWHSFFLFFFCPFLWSHPSHAVLSPPLHASSLECCCGFVAFALSCTMNIRIKHFLASLLCIASWFFGDIQCLGWSILVQLVFIKQ